MNTKFDQMWKSIEDVDERREFNLDIDTGLAFQIKLLREKNGWTQQQLAESTGSNQETISQWENPNYGRYTLRKLKALAAAFDVGLMVKFAPFSEVVEWNANLTPERLAPPSYAEEQAAYRATRVHQSNQVYALAHGLPFQIKSWAAMNTAEEQLESYARILNTAPSSLAPTPPSSDREPEREERPVGQAA